MLATVRIVEAAAATVILGTVGLVVHTQRAFARAAKRRLARALR